MQPIRKSPKDIVIEYAANVSRHAPTVAKAFGNTVIQYSISTAKDDPNVLSREQRVSISPSADFLYNYSNVSIFEAGEIKSLSAILTRGEFAGNAGCLRLGASTYKHTNVSNTYLHTSNSTPIVELFQGTQVMRLEEKVLSRTQGKMALV